MENLGIVSTSEVDHLSSPLAQHDGKAIWLQYFGT